jgi:hypothetical protein
MIRTVSELRTPPPPPKPKNTRQHPRHELMASVEVHHGSDTLVLAARNLSLGGIFLAADDNDLTQLALGTNVELLVFNAADEESPAVRALAQVVRHDEGGVGLKWKSDPETSKQVTALLRASAVRPGAG